MSVTVADCMRLAALREAEVVAGKRGIDKIVSAVSVLEYAETSVLVDGMFFGNEIIITAFVSIKNDVEAQIRAVRRMHECGIAALLIYYVGVFVPYLDQRLLNLANELAFPILTMPYNRFDYRYGEAISEIMEMVFSDQMRETYIVSGMLERISQLPDQQRTIHTILRMLSDRLRCSLLLVDKSMEPKGEAAWPMAVQWEYGQILASFKNNGLPPQGEVCEKMLSNKKVFLSCASVSAEQYPNMYLFAVGETEPVKEHHLTQAAEVVQLFLNIWKFDFTTKGVDSLVKAILNENAVGMRQLAAQLHIDIDAVQTMWLLKERHNRDKRKYLQRNARRAVIAKQFLQEHYKIALVDTFEDAIIMLMDAPPYHELDTGLAEMLLSELGEEEGALVIACSPDLRSVRDAAAFFSLFQECWEAINIIYPAHSVFTAHKLRFARQCRAILEEGNQAISSSLSILQALKNADDADDLIDTLSVFLLDSNNNMQETGDRMFLHKNTVKYRINKIKQRLGFDVAKMPESYALYLAVALNRML